MSERQPSHETAAARWREADSARFRELGELFVPGRELQVRIMSELVPGGEAPGDGEVPFGVVDLGCGDGVMSAAILRRWPGARVLAIDASASMLAAARGRCERWGDRFDARHERLEETAARGLGGPLRAVVSSLAIHHLDDDAKRRLFAIVAAALAPRGAFIIADVVQPGVRSSQQLAARLWDEAVGERCAAAGRRDALEIFRNEGWNMFALPQPDPEDHPAPLASQLRWLEEAGFRQLEVYWCHAGHAVFGGRRP